MPQCEYHLWCNNDMVGSSLLQTSLNNDIYYMPQDEYHLLTLKWPRYFYSHWCPRGVPRDPTVENHFPTGILQWNLHHIFLGYKNSQFCKKKIENFVPFQNGSQITNFYFASFRFWPKFEKTLSERNFCLAWTEFSKGLCDHSFCT